MNTLDRSIFLPDNLKKYADLDEPLEIGFGQTQSAPHMNGIILEISNLKDNDVVLEIGTGTGYLTALLAYLAKRVVSVEIIKNFATSAKKSLEEYGIKNVDLINGDINTICLKEKFSLIISAASFKRKPKFLYEKLSDNGRLVYPLGSSPPQILIYHSITGDSVVAHVSFVNIINEK